MATTTGGSPAGPLVRCDELTIGYRGSPILSNISFTAEEGNTVAIIGPSGSGKSTLLKTLAGIIPPVAGRAIVFDTELPDRPARGTVGYIPQNLGLVEHESVLRNVLHGHLAQLGWARSIIGQFPSPVVNEARESIDRLGLTGLAETRVKELSGGQRRRVAIARAFLQRPRILLADEMFSELDPDTSASIVSSLFSLQQETAMSVIMVEHNQSVAREVADQVLEVRDDRLQRVEGGP